MDITRVLQEQDLSGANLSGMSLGGRDLRGKNLRGADLSYAHLGNADLSGADLRNANLCNANLGAANLTGADLRYSNVCDANLSDCILNGSDLRDVVGLNLTAPLPISSFVKPIHLEETEEFIEAKRKGFFPISHWGKSYSLADGRTLYKNPGAWQALKTRLGDVIFGDRKTFSEVRLVKQYKHYSQWAYMVSKNGFERIADGVGLKIRQKRA